MDLRILVERLHAAGFPVASVTPVTGGVVALAGLVTLADGRQVFAKTVPLPVPASSRSRPKGCAR